MLLVPLLLILLGVLIKFGKMYWLIAGYNTMSPEQKSEYDIEKIADLFFKVMLGMAGLMLLGYLLSRWLENPKIDLITFFVALAVGIPYLLVKANSKAYKK